MSSQNPNTDLYHRDSNQESNRESEEKTEQQVNTSKPDEMLDFTFEVETDKSEKTFDIGTIKKGETKTIIYQVRVKEDATEVKHNVELSADGIETLKAESKNTVVPGKVKLELKNNVAKENVLSKGNIFANTISIKNITNEKLSDIKVSFVIPKGLEFYELYESQASNNYKVLQQDPNYVVFSINELAAGATKDMLLSVKVVDEKVTDGIKQLQYTVTIGDKTYYSNQTNATIGDKRVSKIDVKLSANIEDETKTGDKLNYTVKIENTGSVSDLVTVKDFVPEAAVVKKAYYVLDGKETQITNTDNNAIVEQIVLEAGKQADLVIETEVNEEITGRKTITNEVTVSGNFMEGEEKVQITHKLKANQSEEPTTDPKTPEEPDPTTPTTPTQL